jgi:HD-GYP domain-containing protein (c-di-GMP phosphodiesterase class II)
MASSKQGSGKKTEKIPATDFDPDLLSRDKRLNHLLSSVLAEVRLYAEDQIKHIKKLTEIALALSVEKNIGKLLELIVDEARDLSNADAGTLYILDPESKTLEFEIFQNKSLNIRMGGTSGIETALPHVPLYYKNKPNHRNVSSHVALTGTTINIQDVYEAEGFDFTGTREYDRSTGYRSKSMLVIPMKNNENRIIGVLQLLNAVDPETRTVVAFSAEYHDLIAALASQAAVAITNTRLTEDLKNLFYAFIQSIATAIDEKSPYTGGHIKRVVDLTMMIAEQINAADQGRFANFRFDENQLEELRLAAWMHDVGKITTPEHIIDKTTKLEGIMDGVTCIQDRFHLIEILLEMDAMGPGKSLPETPRGPSRKKGDKTGNLDKEIAKLRDDLAFIAACNQPETPMTDDKIKRLKKISGKTYFFQHKEYPYLTKEEVNKLSIQKGTLDPHERKIVENHALMTQKILNHLPFPENLARVPEYAGAHHEKPDGRGYPQGLSGEAVSLQARILAIADIFEALTARDRPYKVPVKTVQVLKIMENMKNETSIDPDVYDIFIQSRLYQKYLKRIQGLRD